MLRLEKQNDSDFRKMFKRTEISSRLTGGGGMSSYRFGHQIFFSFPSRMKSPPSRLPNEGNGCFGMDQGRTCYRVGRPFKV